jgi:hypothetical protein
MKSMYRFVSTLLRRQVEHPYSSKKMSDQLPRLHHHLVLDLFLSVHPAHLPG